jgi:hypothetical protein
MEDFMIKWVIAKFVLHMPTQEHKTKKQACECAVICRKGSKITQFLTKVLTNDES